MKDTKTTISEKLYVGLSKKSINAKMVPWGEDSTSKRRMSSVDLLDTKVILDNSPLTGFRIKDAYGDDWTIIDPRGFSVLVPYKNIQQLIHNTAMEKTHILNRCVWSRNGANNILLPVDSNEYNDAIKMTDIVNNSVGWKDIKPGYEITLQNGKSGTFLGKMNIIYLCKSITASNFLVCTTKQYNLVNIKEKKSNPRIKTELYVVKSIKPSKILSNNEISLKDAEIMANDLINDDSCQSNYLLNYNETIGLSSNPLSEKDWKILIEDDTVNPVGKLHPYKTSLTKIGNNTVVMNHHFSSKQFNICKDDEFSNGIFLFEKELKYNNNSSYYGKNTYEAFKTISTDVNTLTEWKCAYLEYSTQLGNTFKHRF